LVRYLRPTRIRCRCVRTGVPSPLNRDDARLSRRSSRWVVAQCNSLERR